MHISNSILKLQDDENGINQELPKPLSGSDRNSFAYPTLKDRVPVIICKVILTHWKGTPMQFYNYVVSMNLHCN